MRPDTPALEWSQSPPAAPGLYWAWDGYEVEAVRVVFDEQGRLGVREYPEVIEPMSQYGDYWLGPLPVPEPPVPADSHTPAQAGEGAES